MRGAGGGAGVLLTVSYISPPLPALEICALFPLDPPAHLGNVQPKAAYIYLVAVDPSAKSLGFGGKPNLISKNNKV